MIPLPKLSEREFQDQVLEYARICGWKIHCQRPARTNKGWRTAITGSPGFPDLVLVRGRVVFAELKREDGVIRPDQLAWQIALMGAAAEYYVWFPSDFERIQEVLR